MNVADPVNFVTETMLEFAHDTGLTSDKPPRRYLWTDAFAVCNFLELHLRTGEPRFKMLALDLVDQVHRVLGRHRADDPRQGWISGLGEEEGARRPTIGGLRIGKGMNERWPDERFDDRMEWDRDGQYFHYLTKWMHALVQVGRVCREPVYLGWAVEMARQVHARFVHAPTPGGRKRIFWKMSIDLSRPLVASMGQHDPLDGLVVYRHIQAVAAREPSQPADAPLQNEIRDLEEICRGMDWTTTDPLGLGGLLSDAGRLARLLDKGYSDDADLLEDVLRSALVGLDLYAASRQLDFPAAHRLAFREFGLSIGLQALDGIEGLLDRNPAAFAGRDKIAGLLNSLKRHRPLAETIAAFWLKPQNRQAQTWREHLDINRVMLATALAPNGFLES